MASKHPYIAATGAIGQALVQLRKNFPPAVDAGTLKKYSLAPNNESYLINTLKFVGIIDDAGQKTDGAKAVFLKSDEEFFEGFANLVQGGYKDLFDLYGPDAWALSTDKLVSFFRQTDETSEVIGLRQARTFAVLAQFAKKRDGGSVSTATGKKPAAAPRGAPAAKASTTKPKAAPPPQVPLPTPSHAAPGVTALTVRIEVNLPPGGDQATYDAIFKSIRANLMP